MKLLQYIKDIRCIQRVRKDKGAANTIEMIFIMLLMFVLIVTVIDFGMYFNNRQALTTAANDGARIAAVFGGVDNTDISNQYGVSIHSPVCNGITNSMVACAVAMQLHEDRSTTQAQVTKITCGPSRTTGIGDRTWCEINYRYKGLPASSLNLVNLGHESTVRVSARTEVVNK